LLRSVVNGDTFFSIVDVEKIIMMDEDGDCGGCGDENGGDCGGWGDEDEDDGYNYFMIFVFIFL
jgi:hypothetical protein